MSPNDRQSTIKALTDSITVTHSFLPFLGAETSSQRSNSEAIWKLVTYRLWELRNALDNEKNPDKQGDLNYLESLAKAYGLRLKDEPTGFDEISKKLAPQVAINRSLQDLCYNVIKIGSGLVRLFGEQMVTTRACVDDVTDYRVSIEGRKNEIVPILKSIEYALDDLEEYRDDLTLVNKEKQPRGSISQPHLEFDAIITKMLILAYDIGSDILMDTESGCEILCRQQERIKELTNSKALKTSKLLYIDQLAFMEDLLWYVLRFDIPAYMNSAELTFTLTLNGITRELLRRRELPQIAEWISPEPYKVLTNNLAYCESWMDKNDVGPSEFHRSIAATLWLEYQHFNKSKSKKIDLPIAISTCYDRSLERACQSLGMPYHVVVPVHTQVFSNTFSTGAPGSSAGKGFSWFYLSYVPHDGQYAPPTVVDCADWENNSDVVPLDGPVIVKLHGSPLEPVTFPNGIDEYERTDPYIILSESEYMSATVIHADAYFNYPPWIINRLKAADDWWFMGYSINDWFIRLRIYQHLSIRMGRDSTTTPSAKVLANDFDAFRTVIFSKLKTPPNSIDLLTVQEAIKLIDPIRDILRKGVEL